MSRFKEIYLLLIVNELCYFAYSTPLFENINIEKKINIELKPFKFKPFTFITEKWGPFGRIMGKKHTIERRDLEDTNVIDKDEENPPIPKNPAERMIPVLEDEGEPPLPMIPFLSPVKAIMPASPPPLTGLNTNILPSIPGNPFFKPSGPVESPVLETKPIDGPLFVPIRDGTEAPPPPPLPPPSVAPAPPPPPPPPTQPKVPPRTIGILSFFREFFTELVTQLIARARSSFSQLGSPPVQQ